MNKETFEYCLNNISFDYKNVVPTIFNWTTNGIALGSHLWYIFSYVQIILWFPLIRYLGSEDNVPRKGRRFVIFLG